MFAIISALILLLIPSSAYAVCNLCVFPIMAAVGVSSATVPLGWLTCLWGGLLIDLVVLYIANKLNIRRHHLDISVLNFLIAGIIGLSLGFYYGDLKLFYYMLAGCALGHLTLVLHCMIRQYKKIPYLRVILINTVALLVGLIPYVIKVNLSALSIGLVIMYFGLYLWRVILLGSGTSSIKSTAEDVQ